MKISTLQSLLARNRNEINRLHIHISIIQEIAEDFLVKSEYLSTTIQKHKKSIAKLVTIQKELKKELWMIIGEEQEHARWKITTAAALVSKKAYFEKHFSRSIDRSVDNTEGF